MTFEKDEEDQGKYYLDTYPKPPVLDMKWENCDGFQPLTIITKNLERFVIIVNGFQPLTIITKHSILDVAAVLDPPLILVT